MRTLPVDRPESDQEGKILEPHVITTEVYEMKVKGYHLIEKKQLQHWQIKKSNRQKSHLTKSLLPTCCRRSYEGKVQDNSE